jgi:hypothetical protein
MGRAPIRRVDSRLGRSRRPQANWWIRRAVDPPKMGGELPDAETRAGRHALPGRRLLRRCAPPRRRGAGGSEAGPLAAPPARPCGLRWRLAAGVSRAGVERWRGAAERQRADRCLAPSAGCGASPSDLRRGQGRAVRNRPGGRATSLPGAQGPGCRRLGSPQPPCLWVLEACRCAGMMFVTPLRTHRVGAHSHAPSTRWLWPARSGIPPRRPRSGLAVARNGETCVCL